MSEPAAGQHYSSMAKILHWAVAGLIVTQYALANLAEFAAEAGAQVRQVALLANHKSVGISILALALLRLAWRAAHHPPPLPAAMPHWQVAASRVSHGLLYALLLAMPVSGWLMSSASAYSVSWFNLFQLPDLVAPDPELKEAFERIHEVLAWLLAAVAALHILAAFKHALIDRDGVLRRMSSAVGLGVFAAAALFGILVLGAAGRGGPAAREGVASQPAGGADAAQEETARESNAEDAPPRWDIDYGASFIRFTGDQAGAQFQGVWPSWEADIRFSGRNLGASSAIVAIDTGQADTQDAERDDTLIGPEWFDADNFPQAQYLASSFSRREDGAYAAQGELIIKGVATPATLNFSVRADGDRRVLAGEAQLDRIALGVGTGEWLDTSWVGKEVRVDVRVEAKVQAPPAG